MVPGAARAFNDDEDTVFVFATMVRSTNPVTIPLVWNGDDGHSVFVNGIFVGGGGGAEEGVPRSDRQSRRAGEARV